MPAFEVIAGDRLRRRLIARPRCLGHPSEPWRLEIRLRAAFDLERKTIVLTGASSGIGRELARDLGPVGARLVLAARRREALEELASELRGGGTAVLVQPTDVTDYGQCRELMQAALREFGSIDYLVLNAGMSMWARVDEITEPEVFRRLMQVNYLGSVFCVLAALGELRRSRGAIVAVTSTQAIIGLPRHSAYSASKQAVRGFLESLDLELNGEVRILQVMPGWIKGTDLRERALRGDGETIGESRRPHSRQAVSVQVCSRRIVQAMQSGKTELYVPAKLRLVPWLKLLAPGWLKHKIRRAVGKRD